MVREQFEKHLLKPQLPKFEAIPTGVKVTLYAADMSKLVEDENAMHWANQGLNERQIHAMNHLEKIGQMSRQEYERMASVSRTTAHRDLTELVQRGILELRGTGRNAHYALVSANA